MLGLKTIRLMLLQGPLNLTVLLRDGPKSSNLTDLWPERWLRDSSLVLWDIIDMSWPQLSFVNFNPYLVLLGSLSTSLISFSKRSLSSRRNLSRSSSWSGLWPNMPKSSSLTSFRLLSSRFPMFLMLLMLFNSKTLALEFSSLKNRNKKLNPLVSSLQWFSLLRRSVLLRSLKRLVNEWAKLDLLPLSTLTSRVVLPWETSLLNMLILICLRVL